MKAEDNHLQAKERGLRTSILPTLSSQTPSLQNCEKIAIGSSYLRELVPLSLWYFVMAALANQLLVSITSLPLLPIVYHPCGCEGRIKFIPAINSGYLSHSRQSCTVVQFSSVAQSCPTLCDPVNHSTPNLPVHHQLPEFTQTHVHRVSDAIQPSHPLSSPFPPAPNISQHQSLFQ